MSRPDGPHHAWKAPVDVARNASPTGSHCTALHLNMRLFIVRCVALTRAALSVQLAFLSAGGVA
jgi:hypothetical protein